jgi:virginiamycin A acetyltransferase
MANYIHPSAIISDKASIDVSKRGTHTYIGENSEIDDFVKIKHVGGKGDIRIGNNSYINSGGVLYSGNGITIGDNVLIGPNCNIVPVNHEYSSIEIPIRKQGFQKSKGGIIIENDVWLGAGVTLLDGALIGTGCVIAANSLVIGETEKNSVYAGVPAKKIKSRL